MWLKGDKIMEIRRLGSGKDFVSKIIIIIIIIIHLFAINKQTEYNTE